MCSHFDVPICNDTSQSILSALISFNLAWVMQWKCSIPGLPGSIRVDTTVSLSWMAIGRGKKLKAYKYPLTIPK